MVYEYISSIVPKKIRNKYRENIQYSGFKINPYKFMGFVIFFGVALSLAIAFDLKFIFRVPFLLTFIISLAVIEISVYLWLLLKVDAKSKFVEKSLPDALQLMASNLRAGITTDRALLSSARPEFGPLKDELHHVGKEIATGKDIGSALMDMNKRIRSDKLLKTTQLINSGLKSGGSLSSLLDQTSKNLRQQGFVEERIRSNVMMYVIFIFVAVGIGSPILFGLSSFLVNVLTNIVSTIEIPETAVSTVSVPVSFSEVTIDPGFVLVYSIVSLISASIMASLIVGLISKGEEKKGVKFIPMLIGLTLFLFFLARIVISNVLGGLAIT